MKVLHVIPGESEGNAMIFAKRQVKDLRQIEVEAETFFLRSRTSPLAVIKEAIRLTRQIRDSKPDVVHAQFGTVTAFLCAICSNVPLVITYRGSDLNPAPSMPRLRLLIGHLLSQLASLRAVRIVCVSEQLRRRLWWRREIVKILPSGVDTTLFKPASKTHCRGALGWKLHERVVLFNAGTTPQVKRVDLAKAAVAEARTIIGPITLHVLDGTTPQRDVITLLNAADCILLTSDYEGSPTIIQEALACNTPIVSVAAGDVPERISNVSNTRITSREPSRIAAAIVDLIRLGARTNGREQMKQLDSRMVAIRLADLYREAVAPSR